MADGTGAEVNRMHYTTETIDRKILGPYTGKHIAGTSEHVFDSIATIDYRFDGFVITVADVPVHWDEERQRQYISGTFGIEMNRKVKELAAMLQRRRAAIAAQEQVREQQERNDAYERTVRLLVQRAKIHIVVEALDSAA
jgi:hypothetical protein